MAQASIRTIQDLTDPAITNELPITATKVGATKHALDVSIATPPPLSQGAATEATLLLAKALLDSLNTKTPGLGQSVMLSSQPVTMASDQPAIAVSGPLTDVQLRSSAVAVTGPLTDAQLRAVAVQVLAASLPLPAGAATEVTLASIDTKTPTLGQKVMSGSVPVVLASNQSTIAVSGPLTDTQLRDSSVKIYAGISESSEGLIILDTLHAKIHQGKIWHHRDVHTFSPTSNPFYYLMVTPSDVDIHFYSRIATSKEGLMEVYEGSTTTADGVAASVFNKNRQTAGSPKLSTFHGPTVTVKGTLIEAKNLGSSVGMRQAVEEQFPLEFVLKRSTKYLIKLTTADATNAFSVHHYWYED